MFSLFHGTLHAVTGEHSMSSRRKLLIYTHAMSGGGAERVCALLASGFAGQGDEVLLATDFESPDR